MSVLPRRVRFFAFFFASVGMLARPSAGHETPRRIAFPNVPGYVTLVCDFHAHTVFSDGKVWPTLRVEEAAREGLDALAITDHLEYQPHAADIPHPDRNRGHALASVVAEPRDILVLRGGEITRDMPPGHANAIFLQDVNALRQPDVLAVFREAARQGAFVFWNHPAWLNQRPDGIARLEPVHEQLLGEGLLHGIEVVNEHEFSPEALQIAVDRNLAILGNSDIHGLVEWDHPREPGHHRPVTLVFAAEKTETALKEALFAGRTVVWFKQTLIGRAEWLDPLLATSLSAKSTGYRAKTHVLDVTLANTSDLDLILRNTSAHRFHEDTDLVTVPAHGAKPLRVKTLEPLPSVELTFEVLNTLVAPGRHATARFTLTPPAPTASP